MKLSDIKKCAICHEGVMHTGLPLLWRVKIERFGIDLTAVRRRHGLETFFGGGPGGAALAGVMGPDEIFAKPVMDPVTLILCEDCACSLHPVPIAALAELGAEAAEEKSDTTMDRHGDMEADHARI